VLTCEREKKSSSESIPTISSGAAANLRILLSSTADAELAASLDMRQLLGEEKELTKDSPMWPIFTFLVAEVHWSRKEVSQAQERYRTLLEWAAGNPYGDGWGGSALAAVALWRWLQAASADSVLNPNEGNHVLDIAERLMEARLVRRVFDTPILSTLPQIQEDALRRLSLLAWSIGSEDRALRLFLDYLMVSTTAVHDSQEIELMNQVLSSGLASADRLTLMRGKRLYFLKRHQDAFELLKDSRKSKNPQVRAEAGYYVTRIERIKGSPRDTLIGILNSVIEDAADPDLAQKALFYRAIVFNREGHGRNVQQFVQDLLQLTSDFPQGRYVDNALYELARHYQIAGDLESAIHYFEKLREFEGENDWVNQAAFQPAIALYTRGESHDMVKATALLQKLDRQNYFGTLHLAALFWLGRMAEEAGDQDLSNSYFERIIAQCPYNYYAIRARMHLHRGEQASGELWPDPETKGDVLSAYQARKVENSITGNSPYHARLRDALNTGLYSIALNAHRRMRQIFPSRRLEEVSLAELNKQGLLPQIGLLLSLRQDAKAAVDAVPQPSNRLQIAGAVGHAVEDWPLSMSLVMAIGEPLEKLWIAQQEKNYLATAFPPVFAETIMKSSAARGVRPELIYSIIRRESLFYPSALSPKGALGLFQFTPPTFDTLNNRWRLLESSAINSGAAFLLDPDLSIDLGARWFQDELLARQKGDILLSIMEHNAGYPAVRKWIANWKKVGRSDDVEYMIETMRFAQTRIFARAVLTDMVIADAMGFLSVPGQGL